MRCAGILPVCTCAKKHFHSVPLLALMQAWLTPPLQFCILNTAEEGGGGGGKGKGKRRGGGGKRGGGGGGGEEREGEGVHTGGGITGCMNA